jgi:hypothetical protein
MPGNRHPIPALPLEGHWLRGEVEVILGAHRIHKGTKLCVTRRDGHAPPAQHYYHQLDLMKQLGLVP